MMEQNELMEEMKREKQQQNQVSQDSASKNNQSSDVERSSFSITQMPIDEQNTTNVSRYNRNLNRLENYFNEDNLEESELKAKLEAQLQ